MRCKFKIENVWTIDRSWLSRFTDLLSTVSAVSFDVFDTALTRSVDAPVDVFAIVEEKLIQRHGVLFSGYAEARELAEQTAREKAARHQKREIGFQEIVEALETQNLAFSHYRSEFFDAEMEAERECCFAVPEIKAAFDLCRDKGIPVFFVSDMYLPETAIRNLLENAGYEAPELIVSCETGCAKWDGSQWPIVTQKWGNAEQILHIGDNEGSDVRTAQQAGLKTLIFKRARSNHRPGGPLTPAVLPFSRLLREKMLTLPPEGDDFDPTHLPACQTMALLGASWGALVAGSYVRWIADRAQALGLSRIYFCARDGWLPQLAWHAAGLDKTTGIKTSYLYISRRSLNFAAAAISCTPAHLSERALETLCNVFRSERLRDVLARADLLTLQPLVDDVTAQFGSLDRSISWHDGVHELKDCMQRHAQSIYPVLQAKLLGILSYLCQEGLHEGKIGIVDVGWHGTMQASIRAALSNAGYEPMIYGLYAGLWPAAQRNRVRTGWMEASFWNDYQSFLSGYGLYNNIAIIENTFSSAEGTTLGYKQQGDQMIPTLAEADVPENQHEALIAPFQNAAADVIKSLFSGEVCNGVSGHDIAIDAAMMAINRLGLSPTNSEIAAIGSIRHSGDPSHATLTPIVRELTEKFSTEKTVDLGRSDWAMGSALTALNQTDDAHRRHELAENFRSQLSHYDSRTLGQLK